MEFQPSVHSYDPSYDGWFQNVWTREGRAENKIARAERKREKGNEKAADRLEHRAAVLEAKAEGKRKSLTLKSPPAKLWKSEYPWIERPPPVGYAIAAATVGAGAMEKLVEPIAKGARPPSAFARREMRSTILGGLQALQAAEVEGYAHLNLDGMNVPITRPEKYDDDFMQMAGNASSLKDAAEFIRGEVVENKLAKTAWYLRGVLMIQPAVYSAMARQAAGAIVSLIVPIGTIVGSAISAGEAVHMALLQKVIKDYTQKAQESLQTRGMKQAAKQIETQIEYARQVSAMEGQIAQAQTEAEARDLANTIKIGSYGILALAAGGMVVLLVKRSRA